MPHKDEILLFRFIPLSSKTMSVKYKNMSFDPETNEIFQLVRRLKTKEGSDEFRRLLNGEIPAQESTNLDMTGFSIEQETSIGDLLCNLGAEEVLASDATDLRGFIDDDEKSLYLHDAVHRAKITIFNENTCASASTALCSFSCSREVKNLDFYVEPKTLFLIYDRPRRAILFIGTF
ncbi:hypothetical protein P5V15_000341 [Pogonomyrmex californicus]